jgi:DNA-binding response OmpR family regulator
MAERERRRIVVIDDDDEVRGLIRHVLEAGGYAVADTGDPAQAAALVRAEDPALVLCDISMPGLDGYGVLRELQSDPATARYPVVFLTAQREFTERVQAFRYGVVDYVAKPFTREILLRKVAKVLAERARRSGVAEEKGPAPSSELVEDVRRDSRSGLLTVDGVEGEARVVMQAGEVVEATGAPAPDDPTARARFEEIDARHEDIASHDPPRLPGRAPAPSFEGLPEVVRDVLVVDDNKSFRRFVAGLLARQGFTVHEAADGEEGLRLALERRPWLILTDVRMPRMDGFEFCRRVRSHSLIRQTPLLFLSGWDDYKQRYQGLELGADDFLSKDTPIREMLIRIQLLMRRYEDLGVRARKGAGMEGQVDVVGAPGVLQICHLTRLTGTLTAVDGGRRASVRFRDGEIVDAQCEDVWGEDAVFAFLAWTQGRFHFHPGDPGEGVPLGESFNQMILEGCRRLDEQRGRAASGTS